MHLLDELSTLVRARCPLIVVGTLEEERVLTAITELAKARKCPAYRWDLGDGCTTLTEEGTPSLRADDALQMLDLIAKNQSGALFFLPDFHKLWSDSKVCRKLRTVAQALRFTRSSLVVSSPTTSLPDELSNGAVVIDLPLPDEGVLAIALDELLKNPALRVTIDETLRRRLLSAALGLTYSQAQRVFAKVLVQNGGVDASDVDFVFSEKRDIIRTSQALEFYPVREQPSNVGGLRALKEWLQLRKQAFSDEAREFGLPPPKGVALIGIPGTGKSLSAKMIAQLWGLPLVRFDVGALFGSYVGESEERTRRTLELTERIAPCVLWLDEMEKALAHGGNDSGTSTRVFGTILTWMAEKSAAVFVAATANDISKLPPELLRRGRFDEIFFLDLPNEEERRAILEVHLKKRRRDPSKFDLDVLVASSDEYVGAEIEQAIIDALFQAFSESREVTTADVQRALQRLIPLARSQVERIAYLRSWLVEGRATSASAVPDPKLPEG
jgi:AAA+ superfamily predicted ATPase